MFGITNFTKVWLFILKTIALKIHFKYNLVEKPFLKFFQVMEA